MRKTANLVDLPTAPVSGDQPYPVGRMIANLFTLFAIANLSSFSVWSAKLMETFPAWTTRDVGLVYSFGVAGAWLHMFGGFLDDALGSRTGLAYARLEELA